MKVLSASPPRGSHRTPGRPVLSALLLLTVAGIGLAESPPQTGDSTPDRAPWDRLDQEQLQQLFRLLDERFLATERLSALEWNRSAVAGLAGRAVSGLLAFPSSSEPPTDPGPYRFLSGTLGGRIAYLRPAGPAAECLAATDRALAEFAGGDFPLLILDLRSPADPGFEPYPFAAELLDRFLGPNLLLFEVRGGPGARFAPAVYSSRSPAAWDKDLVVLIDEDTPPSGEVTAAVLRHYRRSPLFGSPTPGSMLLLEEHPLAPDVTVRFAVAQVVLPGDRQALGIRIEPDVAGRTAPPEKRALFLATQAGEMSLDASIAETPRPRLNEAALVAGTNPELPALLARARGETVPSDSPALRDRTLQLAVDTVRIRRLLRESPPPSANTAAPAPGDAVPDAGAPSATEDQ